MKYVGRSDLLPW